MADTAARMLALLGLLQARSDWSGAELADRLGVTDRTIRNDIDRLRGLGYPVDAVRGPSGRYRLRARPQTPPPPAAGGGGGAGGPPPPPGAPGPGRAGGH